MNSDHDRGLYHPSSFDDDMCLKPPLLLWLAVLYLSRAIVLPIGIGLGHFAHVDANAFESMRSIWTLQALLPALLALPVLYALIRRAPTAGGLPRWVWAHGRIFLIVSAGVDIAPAAFRLVTSADLGDDALPPSLGLMLIDLYFLAYVLLARRVRDSFKDFPLPSDGAGK